MLYGDNVYLQWKLLIFSLQGITSDNTCILLVERIMALQQMIDKKNTFSFIELILSGFYAGQILSAVPV